MASAVRPFSFTGLPHWTKEQVAVHEGLATYLSYKPLKRKFAKTLATELENFLKTPVRFSRPEFCAIDANEVSSLLPEQTCLLVVGAAPSEHKILVDLDSGIAAFCIDRLLGGTGKAGRIMRPLTKIEQGVFSFIVLKVLQQFHRGWQNGREVAFTLDRFAATADDVADCTSNAGHYHMIALRMAIGKRIGYVRILLPQALVTQSFYSPATQAPSTDEELEVMRQVLACLGQREVPLQCEVANLNLTGDDIANIEVGDIIVLENHQLTRSPHDLTGFAVIKIGRGKNGGLKTRFVHQGDLCKLEIQQITVVEQPPEEAVPMVGDDSNAADFVEHGGLGPGAPAHDNDNLRETEGLLRDVPAPVVVELGRIKLNAQQVVKLRPGQILRLPRGPNDPVNLVVNDKLFARGELIEVDGELGVRLLQVVGH
jgi:flagellar motor switch protein FliM